MGWSLGGPLSKLCLMTPTLRQNGLQAKNSKKGVKFEKIFSSESIDPIYKSVIYTFFCVIDNHLFLYFHIKIWKLTISNQYNLLRFIHWHMLVRDWYPTILPCKASKINRTNDWEMTYVDYFLSRQSLFGKLVSLVLDFVKLYSSVSVVSFEFWLLWKVVLWYTWIVNLSVSSNCTLTQIHTFPILLKIQQNI